MAVMAVEAAPIAAEAVGVGGAAAGGAARTGASKTAQKAVKPPAVQKSTPSSLETAGQAGLLGGSGGGSKKTSKSTSPASKKSGKSVGAKLAGKVGNRKSLLAELVVCMVILLLGSMVRDNDDGTSSVVRLMVKGSALLAVFFVLSIMSTGGPGAQKAAGAIGLLVVMTYALTSQDVNNILKWTKSFFKPGVEKSKGDTAAKASDKATDTNTGDAPADSSPPSAEV